MVLRSERAEEFARYLSADVPIGTLCLVAGTCDDLPPGWLVCEGQVLAVSEYPELGERVGPRYVRDTDDPDSFRLPDLRGLFAFDLSKALPWWLSSRPITYGGVQFLTTAALDGMEPNERPVKLGELRWVVKAR